MRPSLLVPTLLICALKIPFGKADDLDPTPWRSYSDPEHAQGYEDSARHVGLYIGNRRFIHAPRTGQTIRIDSLDNLYWQRNYTTARRFSG